MEGNKAKEMIEKIRNNLSQQVEKLEGVKKELEEDLRLSIGPEREKNQKLLDAAVTLLNDMKKAHANIVEKNRKPDR
jgi:hypothetical protein